MITNVLNMMNAVFKTPQAAPQKVLPKTIMENPFASPFISQPARRDVSEWRNQPVKGGYFAGYYNGKPNIVGRQLFISV